MAETIDTAAATDPLSVTSDGLTVNAHPLPDQIQRDRYGKAATAKTNKYRGLMFNKIIPAGPMSDSQATGIGGAGFDRPGIV